MEVIEAKFRIVTPMFISGADQTKAELRVPSIKGALRFWWRALNYEENPKILLEKESKIFGSSDQNIGESKIKIHMESISNETIDVGKPLEDDLNSIVGEGARYLGYGLMGAFGRNGGILERPCIKHNSEVVLKMTCPDKVFSDILSPLKTMALLGNLGSRSRRGYGSISCDYINVNEEEMFSNPEDSSGLKESIIGIIPEKLINELTEYTAFSSKTRMIIARSGNNALKVLDDIGKEMMRYRSWGHKGKVLGKESEKNFKDDHDWSKNPTSYIDNYHPRRIAFGLPQNYSKNVMVEPESGSEMKSSRRASPLFIHIAKTGDNKYHGIITLFESKYLPENYRINAANNIVDQNVEYKVLHEYLDRFSDSIPILRGE